MVNVHWPTSLLMQIFRVVVQACWEIKIHFITCSALVNTCIRAHGTTHNKLSSSKWRISLSFVTTMGGSSNFHDTHLMSLFWLCISWPKNLTTKRMGGGVCASIRITTARSWHAQCMPWDATISIYEMAQVRPKNISIGLFCEITALWCHQLHISTALKIAALVLDYTSRGFLVDRIDIHSLHSGGANALLHAGYTDCQIQKMGRWKGSMFKQYIQEEFRVFWEGMSHNMKCHFRFVNIAGGA